MLNRETQYAIRTLIALSESNGEYVSTRALAEQLNIPYFFLSKILQKLVRRGLVDSRKGLGGGVRLRHSPEEITGLMVLEAVDDTEFLESCVLGFPQCNDQNPCPYHHEWGPIRSRIQELFATHTLAELRGLQESG